MSSVPAGRASRNVRTVAVPVAAVLVGAAALCGCAIDYVDADGNRRIVGLAMVTIPSRPVGPDVLGACARAGTVETVGLLLYRNEGGAGIGAGYVDQSAMTFEACPDAAGPDREARNEVR